MARILVVDDYEQIRNFYYVALMSQGHEVFTAANGFEAILLLKAKNFDLVVTDYDMPGMKGDELAFEIKDKCPMPVIMITGSQFPATDKIDCFFQKPVQLKPLFDKVRELLKEP